MLETSFEFLIINLNAFHSTEKRIRICVQTIIDYYRGWIKFHGGGPLGPVGGREEAGRGWLLGGG